MQWTGKQKLAFVFAVAVRACETSATQKCASDFDCSLAGTCETTSGTCKCKSWASGPDCAALNLKPLASSVDVEPSVLPLDGWTRWGGSPIYDDGQYHLFSAEMGNHCGLSVWGHLSTVIHSVSDNPGGPYTRQGIAIPAEAHNPVVSRASDGTWLIWTCGCPNPNASTACKPTAYTCPGGAAAAWTTTVYSSASLSGPWTPHVNILGSITKGRLGSQNVSPIMFENGTVALMFKGPDNNTEASIATAPHWSGPYTLRSVNIFSKVMAAGITNEDCWMWQDVDGTYHMLSHRMSISNRESLVSGGHGFAQDLLDWHYALTPAYTDNVTLANGLQYPLKRRERPQLLFDKEGAPMRLFNGVADESGTFTFSQPFA